MPVQMRGKLVGVEKMGKAKNDKSFLAMPEDTSAAGFIRYLGEELKNSDLKVGMKVYFGKDRHEIQINGTQIMVMDEKNVYAIVAEDQATS